MEDYWITIPSGEFLMGSSDEELEEFYKYCPDCDFSIEQPQHWVDLPEFQIGKYEITNKQYNQCVRSNVCSGNIVPTGLDHPVTNVNWHAANTYCKWVGGRLPTEAEWEKVASWDAKTQTKLTYPWGDNELNESMVNLDISSSPTTPVGTFPNAVSPYGVYDMSGNVWEWVSSLYMPYPYDSNDGRENMSSLESRVLRGGGWDSTFSFRSMFVEFRSTYRHWDLSINASTYIRNYGFRCSRSLP
jgi:formylglycine-generating enzyme required for sulfatase activity